MSIRRIAVAVCIIVGIFFCGGHLIVWWMLSHTVKFYAELPVASAEPLDEPSAVALTREALVDSGLCGTAIQPIYSIRDNKRVYYLRNEIDLQRGLVMWQCSNGRSFNIYLERKDPTTIRVWVDEPL